MAERRGNRRRVIAAAVGIGVGLCLLAGIVIGIVWMARTVSDIPVFAPSMPQQEFVELSGRDAAHPEPVELKLARCPWRMSGNEVLPNTGPLVRNVCSIEAAIWREAFEQEEPLQYPSTLTNPTQVYDTVTFLDNATYPTLELKRSSWRFWFRQKNDASGAEQEIKRILAGNGYHSYVSEDWPLFTMMRVNDATMRPLNHYHRQFGQDKRRMTTALLNTLDRQPALMQRREAVSVPGFRYLVLNLPAGCVQNRLADVNRRADPTDPQDASTGDGWRKDKHKEFRELALFMIGKWYRDFVTSVLPTNNEE